MALLQVEGLSVRYGGLRALDDVSLTVEQGAVVGLIGPNGAGKTTFIDGLTGFAPTTGHALFNGHEITGLAPHVRAHRGLGRTWQSLELFDDLSVEENLLVGVERPSFGTLLLDLVRPGRKGGDHDLTRVLSSLGLEEHAHRLPSALSQGQRKLVGVARALGAEPSLLLMDEPAAGLDTTESEDLGRRIRTMAANGTSILLVDHDMGLVLGVCDYIYVLEFGKLIAEGEPAAIRRDERVVAAYLGESGRKALAAAQAEAPGEGGLL